MFADAYSYEKELDYVGMQRGRQEGLQEGRQEEKFKIARTSLANGLDIDFVATITGLDVGVVESLR